MVWEGKASDWALEMKVMGSDEESISLEKENIFLILDLEKKQTKQLVIQFVSHFNSFILRHALH